MSEGSDFSNAFSGGWRRPAAQPEAGVAGTTPAAVPPAAATTADASFQSLSLAGQGAVLQSAPAPTAQQMPLRDFSTPQPPSPPAPPSPAPPTLAQQPAAPPAAAPASGINPLAAAAVAPPPPSMGHATVLPPPIVVPPSANTGGGSAPKPVRIGEKLISLGLITDDQLQIALQEQKRSKKLVGQILVEMGFLTESALTEVLAESSGTQRFDPKKSMLDTSVLKMIPKDVAMRQKVLAVELQNDVLKLAMADVFNVIAIDQIRRFFPKNTQVIPVFCSETEILELIDRYYAYEMSIDGILEEIETGIRSKKVVLEGETDGYVNPTVRLVNAILLDAIKQGVSDIHFEPEGNFLRLRYRIDGILRQVRSFHLSYWSAMMVRLKIMSGMNIAETRQPQDGRIAFSALGREVDFRVASHPMVHGENIVMRLLDKAKSLVSLDKIGFSEHNISLLKRLLKRPEGIIIVTGPTGSGKTTTLYSVLGYINSVDVNIMTLEDPVEYQLPLIRQTNVREGSTDFVNGIKSLMRQDPDIIFVGEIRDQETAVMAVRAALTGHQVFSTLHTNDALGSIPRLLDIGVPKHLIAGTLICAMAQRLARKLCSHCKKPRRATVDECQVMGFDPDDSPIIHEAVGCDECGGSGYKGRVSIVEILAFDPGLDELIAQGATRRAMMEYALDNGFVRMADDGIDKVVNGVIDLPELVSNIDMTARL